MRIVVTVFVVLAILLPAAAVLAADKVTDVKPAAPASFVPKSDLEKSSYAIGADIGRNFKSREMELDPVALAEGLKAALAGEKLTMTEDEMRQQLAQLRTRMRAKRRPPDSEAGAKNAKEGKAFLAENAKKDGVTTLPSGLQYKIIKKGTGASPKLTDRVLTHYRGTLLDGTEFDSSYKGGKPVPLTVNRVIKGWTEALQLMKVGSKWQLFIPGALAYGASGTRGPIGPNATLIFEVELLSIADPLDIKFDGPLQ